MVATKGDDLDDLQALEEGGSEQQAGFPGAPYDPEVDTTSGGRHDRGADNQLVQQLRGQEGPSATLASAPDAPQGKKGLGGRLANIGKSLLNKAKSNKVAVAGVGIGLGIVVAIVVVALIIASLLKIPNLAGDITAYEFNALSRQVRQTSDLTTEETMAVESASDEVPAGETTSMFDQIKATYFDPYAGVVAGKLKPVADLWTKINALRPSKIIDTLHTGDRGLTIHTKVGPLGKEVLQGVTLDGTYYPVEQVSGTILGVPKKWIPLVRDIEIARNNGAFARSFTPTLWDALGEETTQSTIGQIARGAAALQWLRSAGIRWTAWVVSEFDSKQALDPQVVETEQKDQKINQEVNTGEVAAETEALATAEEEAMHVEQAVAGDPAQIQTQVLPNDGVAPAVRNAVVNNVGDSLGTKILSVTDPVLGIALPICIIYDGSVVQSQPVIDTNTNQQMQAFVYIRSAADQQEAGSSDPGLLKAVQATNQDLSDTGSTIPVQRAEGATVNTSAYTSAESGAGGGNYYDIYSLLGIPPTSPPGVAMGWISRNLCGVLTNTGVAIGLSIGNLAVALATLGTSEAAGEAGAEAASFSLGRLATNLGERILGPKIAEEAGGKLVERSVVNRAAIFIAQKVVPFAGKQVAIVGLTIGATEFMRFQVANAAHLLTSGFSQGDDLTMNADAGANIMSGELCRTQMGCRPLTNSEVAQRDATDQQAIAYENSQKSFTDRYFALSNPNSLVNHAATSISSVFKLTIVSSIFNLSASLFQPLQSMGSFLGTLGVAHAAPDPSTQHYGNVQFGWSNDENQLISSDESYLPLQNQLILDQSGKEAEIAQTYGKCFGYSYNASGDGSFDPTDPNGDLQLDTTGDGSLGHLLANRDISRDTNGNVLDDASSTCSPQYLGCKNPIYGPMVCRFRFAMSYYSTITNFTDLQTVSGN